MPSSAHEILIGDILEHHTGLSVADLSRLCEVEDRRIVELVEEGVLTVLDFDAATWSFGGAALRRARIAVRLQRDLGLNLAGVALALELLEEIAQLRRAAQEAGR